MSSTHASSTRVRRHDRVSGTTERFGTVAVIAATVLVAVAVNIVVWAVGALAGGSFEYTDGGSVQSAAPAGVIVLTAVPSPSGSP